MNPKNVDRERLVLLTDLPNIGKSLARDLQSIGINKPQDLIGKDAFALYLKLSAMTNIKQDPCVLDTFYLLLTL